MIIIEFLLVANCLAATHYVVTNGEVPPVFWTGS
jgi:hypothetical protein